jgi:uncharacterized protein YuzE
MIKGIARDALAWLSVRNRASHARGFKTYGGMDVGENQGIMKARTSDMASLKVWYDHKGDYLEVIFEDTSATLEEIADDVFARRTPEGRVVGFAVFNVSKHDRDKLTLLLEVRAA